MKRTVASVLLPALLCCLLLPSELNGDAAAVPMYYPYACIAGLAGAAGVCTYFILKSVSAPLKALKMEKEELIIELENGTSYVFCTFYITNSANKAFKNRFYFPFAVDQDHKFPKNIIVDYIRDDATVKPKIAYGDRQILFDLFLEKKATTCVHVSYLQEFDTPDITYILTSAKSYATPIGAAIFKIYCPCNWTDVRFSHEPDFSSMSKDRACYTILRSNFTPDKELTISWDQNQ